MKIIKKITNIPKARKLLQENKPIELMSFEEIEIEFGKRIENIKKTKIIDERTNELIEKILCKSSREKSKNASIIFNLFFYTKDDDIRKQILTRYSKYIEEGQIDIFLTELNKRNVSRDI